MELNKFKKLLSRYSNGSANETEKALVDAWYRSYQPEESNVALNETEKEKIRTAIQESIKSATGRSAKLRYILFYRVAASLLLFSAIGLFYYSLVKRSDAFYAISTSTGELEKLVLPDSSIIWLNAVSEIRVPPVFDKPYREVFLEEGEAFFEVRKNAAQPFVIHTAGLDIQVLGTSFNVSAYKASAEVKVSVSTGRVAVNTHDHQLAVLNPDEVLTYHTKTGAYVRGTTNAANVQAWRDGDIYLRQASFAELARVLKNTYGLKLTSHDPAIHSYQFTMLLQRDLPADEVLKLIQSIHNTNHRKEGDAIILY